MEGHVWLLSAVGPRLVTTLLAGLGLVLLAGGGELLVRGASRLARRWGVSPLVIGLTVVAFGTSAPELAVSVRAALTGGSDLALGNVVGSNILNVLLILGVSALITPLVVHQRIVRIDVPLMIGASIVVALLGLDGQLGRLDGLFLGGAVIAYTTWAIVASRREPAEGDAEAGQAPGNGAWWPPALQVLGGLVLLVLGARWLVAGAVELARWAGVGELVIGLTVVAAGTSLPEIAASIVAAVRGERDIAVGNVVGSNLFNLLAVLGATSLLAPAGVDVAPSALRFDVPVMIAVAVACLPVFMHGGGIARWEGALFLAYYGAYVAYLVLDASQHESLGAFRVALVWFALPLTGVTLAVMAWRAWPRSRRAASS
ncbi:MAG: calcium/sodium antiporter [Vicinamibacterales bacterium]